MRTPIDLALVSEVRIPSSVFSLEWHEIFPYERFAYGLIFQGIPALHARGMVERIIVNFPLSSAELPGWSINCGIGVCKNANGAITAYRIECPEMLPLLLVVFTHLIGGKMLSADALAEYKRDLTLLTRDVQTFFDAASAAVREYRERGLASSIRNTYEVCSISFGDVPTAMDAFDLLVRHIANHELAHAFIGQLSTRRPTDEIEAKAFELMADLIATEWLFRLYVAQTPDTEEYRQMRGFSSHAESLYANALSLIAVQLAQLCLMYAASAQRNGGRALLEPGPRHPGGFYRYDLQSGWLLNALGTVISADDIARLRREWDEGVQVLLASLIGRDAFRQIADAEEAKAATVALKLAEELKVEEILIGSEFLRSREARALRLREKGLVT